ncbi:branched-chain amino acid transporter [Anaerosporomusa subterranea]|uniref:Branched-chain amino acid transporter n=1 Tax=Anaerosporomusa subterranea TaxID=1794912 RepID=A0A154BVY3_ANASB|nr:AzlD domain-containing protein [Anaerosporomusa subterranea]KYZ78099.1 branched-chain amino acid transporter [Anaerosporomusa subterranea]
MELLEIFVLIGGMAIVTYLPRQLPLVLLQNLKLSPALVRFMKFIPYAALAALIFPGVLSSTGARQEAAVAGTMIAVLLAYFELNLLLVVTGGIAGALLVILRFAY